MIRLIELKGDKENELFNRLAERGQVDNTEIIKKVEEIVDSVRLEGDRALLKYTLRFDGVELDAGCLKVSRQEIDNAYNYVDGKLLDVIKKARQNIESFHLKQKENSWISTEKDGVILGQLCRPLEAVGVYVPGGTAAYPSSVLMNVIPAKVAGVERIIMVTPPGKGGSVSPVILVAANEAGVDEIYRIGGAQAIAALAFGTDTIPKVDKIVGPGNIYVATAKRLVYGCCDIDMFAGPSEIMIVADNTANATYIAADLLSQAEHDTLASSILVTTSKTLAVEVQSEVRKQVEYLGRKDIICKSLQHYGAIIVVDDIIKALEIVNKIAPEHLELCVNEPFNLLGSIKNAGAIFLGNYSSEPIGDYFAGPNHVLPTGGTARFFSPLNVGDFIKKSSVISYTKKALRNVKDDIILFAEAEGLTAHANAVRIRFKQNGG
jgi:histidinol dehydrogenase